MNPINTGARGWAKVTVIWLAERPLLEPSRSTLRKGRHNRATNFYNTTCLSSQTSKHLDNFLTSHADGINPFCCTQLSGSWAGYVMLTPSLPSLYWLSLLLKLFSRCSVVVWWWWWFLLFPLAQASLKLCFYTVLDVKPRASCRLASQVLNYIPRNAETLWWCFKTIFLSLTWKCQRTYVTWMTHYTEKLLRLREAS